jgi:hypothetical protein
MRHVKWCRSYGVNRVPRHHHNLCEDCWKIENEESYYDFTGFK